MWAWQLIIRRAKKVTFPLTIQNCTPLNLLLTLARWKFFALNYNCGRGPAPIFP